MDHLDLPIHVLIVAWLQRKLARRAVPYRFQTNAIAMINGLSNMRDTLFPMTEYNAITRLITDAARSLIEGMIWQVRQSKLYKI
jgi:hypothetical protein